MADQRVIVEQPIHRGW